ncbi:MAG: hypothetical protein R3D61_08475 [Defluviimonas denitrificans]
MTKHAFAALIAPAASVAPGFAFGNCSGHDKQAAMSCAEGTASGQRDPDLREAAKLRNGSFVSRR